MTETLSKEDIKKLPKKQLVELCLFYISNLNSLERQLEAIDLQINTMIVDYEEQIKELREELAYLNKKGYWV
jgi:flagellar hook-associated protein FlgK